MAYVRIESGGMVFTGSAEADTVYGTDGADTIEGLSGRDILLGQGGSDFVSGGHGRDTVFGGDGDDWHVNGGRDDDVVFGEGGNDRVFGGQGDDLVFGDFGDDTLSGDVGADTLVGSVGSDLFAFGADSGADQIDDFDGENDSVAIVADVNGSGISTAWDALARIGEDGSGDAVLDLDNGNLVVFSGVPPGALTADHFLVV
jgi:serralysin